MSDTRTQQPTDIQPPTHLKPLMESIADVLEALDQVELPSLVEGGAVQELRRQYAAYLTACMRAHVIKCNFDE